MPDLVGKRYGRAPGLYAVAARSPRDIWVVGEYANGGAFIERWDGSKWKEARNPGQRDHATMRGSGRASVLQAVAIQSSRDAWAAGGRLNKPNNGISYPFIEHWDGARWQVVRTPAVEAGYELRGIAASSRTDVWTVGTRPSGKAPLRGLIEHWNGRSWKVVASPFNEEAYDQLNAVVVLDPRNAWAAGGRLYDPNDPDHRSNQQDQALLEHWDGKRWTVVPAAPGEIVLTGLAAVSRSDLWAVGQDTSASKAVIEHYTCT